MKSLKKIFFILFIFLTCTKIFSDSCVTCESSSNHCTNSSKTFFRPRSIIEDATIYLALNNYNNYLQYFQAGDDCREQPYISLYRGFFYQKSTNSKKLASYFLPGNKTSVSIREDGLGDIGSLWLKVIAESPNLYQSTLSFCPQRTVLGSQFNYRQNFECINGLWLDLRFAIYEAVHNLHAKEVLEDPAVLGTLPGAATALEYLSSSEIHYGKIKKCETKNVNFDDIQARLGYTVVKKTGTGHFDAYASVLLPIAPKPTADVLFEPLVGRGHWAIGFGFNGGFKILEKCNKSVVLMGDISYEYLFKAKELRSFDFKRNGEWSRFLRVVDQNSPGVSFPAINFTTLCVDVVPRSVVNLWLAAHMQCNCWHTEFGYNLWWRESEKICLKQNNLCANPNSDLSKLGIFDMGNVCQLTSASTANISQSKTLGGTGLNDVVSDATFVNLSINDIDLSSASHPSALTHKFYGAINYDTILCCREVSIGFTGMYEFSRDRNALQQWGAVLTLNANF